MIPHYKRGCIECGRIRRLEDVLSKEKDVYFVDKTRKTLMRVGYCPSCFAGGVFSKSVVKANLYESEKQFQIERGFSEEEADQRVVMFKEAEFADSITYSSFNANNWNTGQIIKYIEDTCAG